MVSKDIKIDKPLFWKIAFGFIAGVVLTSIISIIIATVTHITDDKNLDNLRNITGRFEAYLSMKFSLL